MKTFTFTRTFQAIQEIQVIVKDEDKFIELCEEHLKQDQSLNYWDLEDMDDDVVELSFGDVREDGDEDYPEFYEQMEEQGFPWSEEDYY